MVERIIEKAINPAQPLFEKFANGVRGFGVYDGVMGVVYFHTMELHAHGYLHILRVVGVFVGADFFKNFPAENGKRSRSDIDAA